jgi:hypothetical protein
MMMHTPKTIGRPDFKRGRAEERQSIRRAGAAMFEAADKVFDHDDRGIHDQSEIERAQAHQIGRDAESLHRDERHQQRQRDD